MFYPVRFFKTLSPGGSISGNPQRTAMRRQGGGESGYIELLQQRAGSLNVKGLL